VVLLAFILFSPVITGSLVFATTPLRIMVSASLLFPCGFLMGMAFPMGMLIAARNESAPQAWYWAINGAFSVIASVLAVVVAVFWGVTATLVTGLIAYCVAMLMLRTKLKEVDPST
jgi:hypothetical protein